MKQRFALPGFAALVGVVGVVLFAWAVPKIPQAGHATPWVTLCLLAAGVIISETRAQVDITVAQRGASVFNFSSGFALAMTLIGPLGIPMLVHLSTVALQDVRRSAGWKKICFNFGQSVITYAMVRCVFTVVTGHPTVGLTQLSTQDLLGLLACSVTFIVTQHVLIVIVMSLAFERSFFMVLRHDFFNTVTPYGMDLGIAATAIPTLQYSPWLLPVLILPVLVLHRSALLRAQREHESLHDVLTGLPNRALLRERLDLSLLAIEEDDDEHMVAVLLIDLDHFKPINDSLGHPVGDLVLCEVASRLGLATREGDTVARLGGDEFAVVVPLTAGEGTTEAFAVAQRIVDQLAKPFLLEGLHMQLGASVGVAIAPEQGRLPADLLARADMALYAAKESRGRAALYDPELEERASEQLVLVGELREALERHELVLRYTPVVNPADGVVRRFDASVHWRHPSRGLLAPEDFLPIAESSGLAATVTQQVLRDALTRLRSWSGEGHDWGVLVTMSESQLTDETFPAQLAALLDATGTPADLLTLALPEEVLMADQLRFRRVLTQLRALGISLSLTSFGRHGAALGHLPGLAVDEVCLDAELVGRLRLAASDEVIVSSMIQLAHSLGMRVSAREVTDDDTKARLRELDCDLIAGSVHGMAPAATDVQDQRGDRALATQRHARKSSLRGSST